MRISDLLNPSTPTTPTFAVAPGAAAGASDPSRVRHGLAPGPRMAGMPHVATTTTCTTTTRPGATLPPLPHPAPPPRHQLVHNAQTWPPAPAPTTTTTTTSLSAPSDTTTWHATLPVAPGTYATPTAVAPRNVDHDRLHPLPRRHLDDNSHRRASLPIALRYHRQHHVAVTTDARRASIATVPQLLPAPHAHAHAHAPVHAIRHDVHAPVPMQQGGVHAQPGQHLQAVAPVQHVHAVAPLPRAHPHHQVHQQHPHVHHHPAPGYMTPPSRAASPSTTTTTTVHAPRSSTSTPPPPPPPSTSTPPLTPSRDQSPASTASSPAVGPDVAVNDRATQRPFACTECGRTFWRKFDCIRHVRTHTRERPFPCAGCGRAFARKDALARHVQFAPVCLAAAADAELRAPMGRAVAGGSGGGRGAGRAGKRTGGGPRAAAVAAMAGAGGGSGVAGPSGATM